jgi:predicted RND superfamily exporter protein
MKYITKYRILTILGLLGATAFFGMNIKDLRRDAGISALIAEDHPDYVFSEDMEELFGATDMIVVGVTAQDTIYTPETIRLIHELTTFFEELEEIDEDDVISLSNVDDMEGRDDELLIEPLISEDLIDTLDAAALGLIAKKVRDNPLFAGKLVSADERSAAIAAGTPGDVSMEDEAVAVLKQKIERKIEDLQAKYPEQTITLSGTPILKATISEYMSSDMKRLFPCAIVIVVLILWVLLRSAYGMTAPILVTLFSVVWTFGLKAILHSPLTIVETTIPIMLIAIGCADGVHIISEFLGYFRQGRSRQYALEETMRLLTLPVILTSVTTGLGFLSLLTAPGVSIRNTGVFLAFGVMAAMVFSLVFIPALTSFYPQKRRSNAAAANTPQPSQSWHAFAEKIGRGVVKQRWLISVAALLILLVSIAGVINVQVDVDEVRYLKPGNAFRAATEFIQGRLGGIVSLDIIIEGREMDTIKQPHILKAIEDLQNICEQDELVSYSLSIADLLKRVNYTLHNNDPAYDRLPEVVETVQYQDYETIDGQDVLVDKTAEISGFEQVAQYLLLYEMGGGDSTSDYVDDEYRRARITARLKEMSSRRLAGLLDRLNAYIGQHLPEGLTVRYSNHYVRYTMMRLVIDSQIYSLLTVLAAIAILMSIIFRSVPVGVMTSLPVFIAVLFNFAVMWLFGVTLNVGTSIVASIGMGVGIDYAIHYFSRFRLLLREGMSYDEALVSAIAETSRAILSNATAVGLGFLALLFSEYQVIGNIGWITALSMYTTAFSSLLVLPATLALFKPRIRWSEKGAQERAAKGGMAYTN